MMIREQSWSVLIFSEFKEPSSVECLSLWLRFSLVRLSFPHKHSCQSVCESRCAPSNLAALGTEASLLHCIVGRLLISATASELVMNAEAETTCGHTKPVTGGKHILHFFLNGHETSQLWDTKSLLDKISKSSNKSILA